ncbi:MAG: TetR family transcriptional regulator [Actinobacteria bacterium]|nr:TetR family transcriptional regulator [Actinomycetota bacterium]
MTTQVSPATPGPAAVDGAVVAPGDGAATQGEITLRERKKDATRRALAERALQLAVERGFHGFTIADLVTDVGVSRRTFSNYFASKAECIAAVTDGWLDDVLDAIRRAPANASLLDILQTGLIAVAQEGVKRWGALQSVADTEPELAARMLAGDEVAADLVSGEVAARTGLAADDIRVRLLAGFAVTAGREVLTRWAADNGLQGHSGDNAELAALLETAFSILNPAGLTDRPAH